MPYVPSANRPDGEHAPRAVHSVHRDRAARVVDSPAVEERDAVDDEHAGDPPMITAAHGATNAHGRVIATRPASMPLHDIEMSGLPYLALVTTHGHDEPGARREQRVDRDQADAQVGRAERGAGVEAHPSEDEDERSDHDVADVVTGDGVRAAVLVELPDARPEHHGQRQRGPAAVRCTTPDPAKSTAP